jgi:hypothetical protein
MKVKRIGRKSNSEAELSKLVKNDSLTTDNDDGIQVTFFCSAEKLFLRVTKPLRGRKMTEEQNCDLKLEHI